MTLVHSCRKHKFVKGFRCWLYLACVASSKKKPKPCKNRYPTYDQNGGKMPKIATLFMTKTAEKPYPLGPHIPIREYPPGYEHHRM